MFYTEFVNLVNYAFEFAEWNTYFRVIDLHMHRINNKISRLPFRFRDFEEPHLQYGKMKFKSPDGTTYQMIWKEMIDEMSAKLT